MPTYLALPVDLKHDLDSKSSETPCMQRSTYARFLRALSFAVSFLSQRHKPIRNSKNVSWDTSICSHMMSGREILTGTFRNFFHRQFKRRIDASSTKRKSAGMSELTTEIKHVLALYYEADHGLHLRALP